MIKLRLTVAILGCLGGLADLAIAQGQQGQALGRDLSSQCAHRRIMPPDPNDDCARKLRSDAKMGDGQGGVSTTSSSYSNFSGPGNAGGQGNGIGPGKGGGQGKGRR
jgi:hypothetical protein